MLESAYINHNATLPLTYWYAYNQNDKYHFVWEGCGETEILAHCWWECKLVQPLWKTTWLFLEKLNTELPYDTIIPLLVIYLKEVKTGTQKNACTCMFIAALLTISRR